MRPSGFKHTEETKAKIAKAHSGVKRSPMTEKQKQKIGKAMKEWHRLNKHPFLGKKLTEETKLKISLSVRGKGNGNWKGGLTELVKGIRRSPELYQWRKAVLERDHYTCQDCGSNEGILAHHIKAVIDYPEAIFDLDNGLTLCTKCHKRHTGWQWLKGFNKRNGGK